MRSEPPSRRVIQILLAERERDPHRRLLTRLWHEAHELPQRATNDPDAWLVTRAFEAWSEHGVAGAAAWMSRWVQLTDPPEWPGAGTWRGRERALARLEEVTSELGATSAEVTEARTIRDQVLAVFELRSASGSPTTPPGFVALFEVDADQILRMTVFIDRDAALRALKMSWVGVWRGLLFASADDRFVGSDGVTYGAGRGAGVADREVADAADRVPGVLPAALW